LGALRNEVAKRENLIPANVYAPLWVTDFPMFEFHEEDGRYYSMHHPFTSPVDEDLELSNARSKAAKQICWPRFAPRLTTR
jgi:aspartyl-tRNA synthetase